MAELCSMRHRIGMQALFLNACALLSICVSASEQTEVGASINVLDERDAMPVLEVTGKRASLASAQEIKKEKIEIVDSVVAEDIGKLPDYSVTDALSRVTGMQILRDKGEGAGVALRGLTQIETTLNGRETFTAGAGRGINFADIPSVMLAGIDVYKSSSANQIEGGIGGSIDMRTHRPFDFAGRRLAGSAMAVHGDLVGKTEPQYAMLASSRWKTESQGEFGILLDAAYQKRAWREDQKSAGNPVARTDIIPGQTVMVPNGTTETTSAGLRERTSTDFVLQWRPVDGLELYTEGSYIRFDTTQDSYQINAYPSATFVPGSAQLFPGTNDLQSITWTNSRMAVLSFARDTRDETKQWAVGGTWLKGTTVVTADVSRTLSNNNLFYSGLTLGGTAANFSQTLSGDIPSTSVMGTNLLDPATFQVTGASYRLLPFQGNQNVAKFDVQFESPAPNLESISTGVRLARREAGNVSGLVYGDVTLTPPIAASGHVSPNPYGNFLPGSTSIGNYLAGDLGSARDPAALYSSLGIATPLPVSGNPLGIWHISEETRAGYLMANFRGTETRLNGNAGMRVVTTRENVTGNQTDPAGGSAVLPMAIASEYTDWLPSANMRYLLREGMYLRGALSKTVTRPDFSQLSPSLTLNRNSVDPTQSTGSAGNPSLKPLRSDNLDLALERYFDASTSVSVTAFYKRAEGFPVTVIAPETYNGTTYQVSRPQNMNPAHVLGAEIGYQQFYDFLPGWMKGLGLQANYTYVDGRTSSSILGQNTPLQNLSANSYNLIGMYELDKVSARLAYNWRSKFLSGVSGSFPLYTKAYGWLDASIAYRLDKRTTLVLDGTNLLRTVRSSYYGVETRPYSTYLNDRQIGLALMFSL